MTISDAAEGFAMDVGFIGIGSMGAVMVPNLVKAGHRVRVWNRDSTATRTLEGVTVLKSPAAAFQNDAVVTMLSDDTAVRSVIINQRALASARADCVHVMTSTISLALVEELQELHRRAGIAYVAAPVFGVPAAAAKAQLNIMVAGNAAAVATVQPLFDAIGQKTWHLGSDPQHANVAKIAGNMMITLAIEAMGEATALTESYGLKAVDFLEIITNTILASPSYKRYGGFIASNSYEPGFKLTLGLKDVNLALEAAKAKNAALPALEIVRENMLKAIDQGLGSKDWSVLAKVTRRRAGLEDGAA
jgi:3-hydroxyisobutyrate dehydrogenase-like beta-hydroxyacid dehydrogenase